MSENEQTSTEAVQPTPNDVAEATQRGRDGETPEETITGLRRALEKANAEAKANRLAAQELDKVKQAQMSDLEKAQAQARTYEEAASKAQADALRWRIAAKHGISDDDAETLLTGADEASLERQAQRLASLATTAPASPKPDLTQAGKGEPPALNSTALEDALKAAVGAN